MRKPIIILLCIFACTVNAVADTDTDCDITLRAAKLMYRNKRWDALQSQCTTYLNQCGPNAEIQQMLDASKRHKTSSAPVIGFPYYEKKSISKASQPKAAKKPIVKDEPKPQPKVEAKPEPKVEAKPEPKVEAKPEPKVEPQPEPEPIPVAKAKHIEMPVEPEPEQGPEPVEPKEIVFTASRTFVEFKEDGGEEQITITSDEAWHISESPNWITAQQKGNTLVVRVARNERFSDREGDVVLANEHYLELRVVVAQEQNHDYLKIAAELINDREGSGGLYTIDVSCNREWQVNNTPKWCITEIKGDKLEIWLDENLEEEFRETDVEVFMTHLPSVKRTIHIHQDLLNHYITIKPNIVTSSGKTSLARIQVRTDQPYYRIESLPAWCKVKEQDKESFLLEIADNTGGAARKAECRVTIEGGNGQTLVVQQEERLNYVTVTPKIIRASARGGVITVHVTSSGSWRVVNLPEWCEVTEKTNDAFKLSIDQNTTGAPRSSSFSISASGIRESVEIRQE